MSQYAHPETLVSTDWLSQHRNDPGLRIVEVDVENDAYQLGHVPGAIAWSWQSQLSDHVRRDVVPREQFEKLLSRAGISSETTVILYGDNNNWFAAWAFWQLKLYGHADVRLLNGGRKKWLQEGRELTLDVPIFPLAVYRAGKPDLSIRAFLPRVQRAVFGGDAREGDAQLVDVRSPQEFTGEVIAPAGLPETAQRGGHIPGARSIPWNKTTNDDGTFRSFDQLKALYSDEGINGSTPVIAYCRIGERSSHSWFVLKYLLGYPDVANYDGSWTEWGNMVAAPIERGASVSLQGKVAYAS